MGRKIKDEEGHSKKIVFSIEDPLIEPFYIKGEEDQFTLFKRNSTIAVGYFGTFSSLIKKIARYKQSEGLAGKTLALDEFVKSYEEAVKLIDERLKDFM